MSSNSLRPVFQAGSLTRFSLIPCIFIAAIRNYHKASGLKQHKCIITLQLWELEVRNGSHWANARLSVGLCSFLKPLREHLFPCLVQLLEVTCVPRPVAAPVSKPSMSYGIFLTMSSLLLPLLPPSSPFKGFCDYIDTTSIIQDNLFMLKSTDQHSECHLQP